MLSNTEFSSSLTHETQKLHMLRFDISRACGIYDGKENFTSWGSFDNVDETFFEGLLLAENQFDSSPCILEDENNSTAATPNLYLETGQNKVGDDKERFQLQILKICKIT